MQYAVLISLAGSVKFIQGQLDDDNNSEYMATRFNVTDVRIKCNIIIVIISKGIPTEKNMTLGVRQSQLQTVDIHYSIKNFFHYDFININIYYLNI